MRQIARTLIALAAGGYILAVLIICLLERPLALTITVVFFLTTLTFGKLEVIGHTLIHGALVVFLLEGPGAGWRPPIALHRTLGLRLAFAATNFAILMAILLPAYAAGARYRHEHGGGDERLRKPATQQSAHAYGPAALP